MEVQSIPRGTFHFHVKYTTGIKFDHWNIVTQSFFCNTKKKRRKIVIKEKLENSTRYPFFMCQIQTIKSWFGEKNQFIILLIVPKLKIKKKFLRY